MKAHEQIVFLAELLNIIGELQETVRDYCRMLTAEQDGCTLEEEETDDNVPF